MLSTLFRTHFKRIHNNGCSHYQNNKIDVQQTIMFSAEIHCSVASEIASILHQNAVDGFCTNNYENYRSKSVGVSKYCRNLCRSYLAKTITTFTFFDMRIGLQVLDRHAYRFVACLRRSTRLRNMLTLIESVN